MAPSGDSGNITLFGESAGAFSCSFLLGGKLAQPGKLFHKVILQSGTCYTGITGDQKAVIAESTAARFAKALGLGAVDEMTDALLQSLSAEEILAAQRKAMLGIGPAELAPFYPGDESFVGNILAGVAKDVPVLAGCCSNELPFLFSSYNAFNVERMQKFFAQLTPATVSTANGKC